MLFLDRRDAGRLLAPMVAAIPGLQNAIVLGLPRGGVPVAYEVARYCRLPLDILTVRKIGAPGQRELAIGAVASGGIVALNPELVAAFQLSEEELRVMIDEEARQIAQCEQAYREAAPPLPLAGRSVILVDDGLATGASMRAAVLAVRPYAAQVIAAIPVAAPEARFLLEREVDRFVCAAAPGNFEAVSQFYRDFGSTTSEEVRELLAASRREQPSADSTAL